jgi:hypothetical protein
LRGTERARAGAGGIQNRVSSGTEEFQSGSRKCGKAVNWYS